MIRNLHPLTPFLRLTSHLIRFMAHLVLFLRSAGLCDVGDELGVRLLLKYVEVLITSRMTDLVASYTAHLPSSTQVSYTFVLRANYRAHILATTVPFSKPRVSFMNYDGLFLKLLQPRDVH